MTIAIFSHPACLQHQMLPSHPECPERIKVIEHSLKQYLFTVPVAFYQASLAKREQLIRVHEPSYVDELFSLSPQQGLLWIDEDTAMNSHTLPAALYAAGAVIGAVDLVMQAKVQAAFCNIRPPGHHAEKGQAMGFCFFNNVAVGAQQAMEQYGIKRLAIIDFDVHHGNGTQDIFQHDERVLYCSSFQHPFYPGYQQALDNAHILNVPLSRGTESVSFRSAVNAAWFAKLAAFQPELVFFSAGFDAHINDPLAELRLKKEDYVWLTAEIVRITQPTTNGRVISVLEGGYHLSALAECVPAHVAALISSA